MIGRRVMLEDHSLHRFVLRFARRAGFLLYGALIVATAIPQCLPAQDLGNFAGYTRHLWQAPDGLPEQTVQAFAQTPDGYLWIGTTGGLLRFDGAHFELFDRQNTPELHENSVFCLLRARNGTLWIGTEGGGIVSYAEGQFRLWPGLSGQTTDFVRVLMQDTDNSIWAGTDGGLLHFTDGQFTRVDATPGFGAISIHSIYRDRDGRLWAGGSRLVLVNGKNATNYSLGSESSQNQVKSILQTTDGTVWVGTVTGLNRMLPGESGFKHSDGIRSTVRVLRETSDGVLWIGTIGQGVFTLKGGKLTQITAPESLPSNTVLNLFEDGEKNLWIGTQTGMLRLTRLNIDVIPLPHANDSDFETIYRDRDGSFWIGSTLLFHMRSGVLKQEVLPGMAHTHVRNVFRDQSGALWVGTDGEGVFRIADGRTTRWGYKDGLSNPFIRSMTQDRDRSMWIATDTGLNHFIGDMAHPRIVRYQVEDGLAFASLRSLLEDKDGDLWVGTDRGLSHLHAGAFVPDAATAAMAKMKVWAIHQDSDGGLWFGTRNNGIYRLRDGRLAHFTTADGLASNAVYSIVGDAADQLWISGPNGVSVLNRRELDQQAVARTRHFGLTFYSIAEMGANTEMYGGTESSGCVASDGDAWFPSNRGPIRIHHLQSAQLPPPPLHIESVLADGVPLTTDKKIVLRPSNSRLEIAFTPIRLGSQDGLRFRYMLEGFDNDWGPVTRSRTADYTNLTPGHYRFLVRTFELGSPGVVSQVAIEIDQRPQFYRTWWFISASILLSGLLIFGLYQYRLHQVGAKFEAVLEERSRLAREIHDTVIQGCTGVSAILEAASMGEQGADSGLVDFARLQLRGTIDEAREAVWNMRNHPEDAGSLAEKLESMTRQVGVEFSIPISCSVAGTPFTVDHPLEHDLLMVAREAMCNAAIHGSPSRVDAGIAYSKRELQLTIIDDGKGFNSDQLNKLNGHHFGIQGMRERVERWGGRFRVTSSSGSGARVEARIPRRF
jgi:ligand-binding sensor domain-containing protein/two-component sensor histidine kinase